MGIRLCGQKVVGHTLPITQLYTLLHTFYTHKGQYM
jgi:hypothetical protein